MSAEWHFRHAALRRGGRRTRGDAALRRQDEETVRRAAARERGRVRAAGVDKPGPAEQSAVGRHHGDFGADMAEAGGVEPRSRASTPAKKA